MIHIPVLQKEVLEILDPKPNENFIDCTIGGAGHTIAILERNKPNGKVMGIEIDTELYQILKSRMRDNFQFSKRLILVNDSYVNLKKIVEKYKFKPDGILLDLGMSTWHIEKSNRGFSFKRNEPLTMRYDAAKLKLTAEEILNNWTEKEIEKILWNYGEERFAKRIARKIIEQRKVKPIKTTLELVEIIRKATPFWYHRLKIHFATKTFQALRIAVNDELSNLEKTLPQALEILKKNGRLAIISFHSLEDRIVKNFFKEKAKLNLLKILIKKPLTPTKKEIKSNPCSRSAKLRAIQKIL